MKFPFIKIITELNEGYRVAITVQILTFYPIFKYSLCLEWEEISLYMAVFNPEVCYHFQHGAYLYRLSDFVRAI